MKTTFYLSLYTLLFVSLAACKQNKVTEVPDQEILVFGEKFDTAEPLTYDAFYGNIANKDSLQATVKGVVQEVCQAKGCWVTIGPSNGEATESTFVQFKDYGFFLPKDCSGKEIIIHGVGYREITSVEELRHYASDEGLGADEIAAITLPKEELKFMASGVIMSSKP